MFDPEHILSYLLEFPAYPRQRPSSKFDLACLSYLVTRGGRSIGEKLQNIGTPNAWGNQVDPNNCRVDKSCTYGRGTLTQLPSWEQLARNIESTESTQKSDPGSSPTSPNLYAAYRIRCRRRPPPEPQRLKHNSRCGRAKCAVERERTGKTICTACQHSRTTKHSHKLDKHAERAGSRFEACPAWRLGEMSCTATTHGSFQGSQVSLTIQVRIAGQSFP